MAGGAGGRRGQTWDTFRRLNRQDWLNIGFGVRARLEFREEGKDVGPRVCGRDNVLEMGTRGESPET